MSFSSLDAVGHAFGPDSHEVQDALVRIDRTIGRLLDALDAQVGSRALRRRAERQYGVSPDSGAGAACRARCQQGQLGTRDRRARTDARAAVRRRATRQPPHLYRRLSHGRHGQKLDGDAAAWIAVRDALRFRSLRSRRPTAIQSGPTWPRPTTRRYVPPAELLPGTQWRHPTRAASVLDSLRPRQRPTGRCTPTTRGCRSCCSARAFARGQLEGGFAGGHRADTRGTARDDDGARRGTILSEAFDGIARSGRCACSQPSTFWRLGTPPACTTWPVDHDAGRGHDAVAHDVLDVFHLLHAESPRPSRAPPLRAA